MDNMTALVSAFVRAYHYRNDTGRVFADPVAGKLLTDEEYAAISRRMAQGVSYFAPGFAGTEEEALRFIVERQLAPPVLARSAFCERALGRAVERGCRQIAVFACGYDTFSLRTDIKELSVFELDRPEMIEDRQRRWDRAGLRPVCHTEYVGCDLAGDSWPQDLLRAGFRKDSPAFGSLLGLSYYLSEEEFRHLLGHTAELWRAGSALCFDYPLAEGGRESHRTRELAAAAGERMKAAYSPGELETLLAETGFSVGEHLDAGEATAAFFGEYDCCMAAPAGVGYCLAVKR